MLAFPYGSVLIVSNRPKNEKTLRQNETAVVCFMPNVATAEQYDLFKTYLAARHAGSAMESMFFEEYRAMIEDSPVDSCLMEIRYGRDARLSGVMLADVLDDGLSAVYSFLIRAMRVKAWELL